MATITGEHLKRALGESFHVTPLLDDSQIGQGSIDLRLGSVFLVPERSRLLSIDSHREPSFYRQVQRRVHVPYGDAFVLHAKAFALTSTLEYVCLSGQVAARLKGRSSPGRRARR